MSGLISSILGNVIGNVLGGHGSQRGLVSEIIQGLLNQNGGIQGMMQQFQKSGFGDIFESWLGTGENKAISGEQLQQVGSLGSQLSTMAQGLGLNLGQVSGIAAALLPKLVDEVSPKGVAPAQDQEHSFIQTALNHLIGSDEDDEKKNET